MQLYNKKLSVLISVNHQFDMVYRSEKDLSQGIVQISWLWENLWGFVLMLIVVGPPNVDNTIPRQKILRNSEQTGHKANEKATKQHSSRVSASSSCLNPCPDFSDRL